MTSDQRVLTAKIRRLSIALGISCAINIGVLALLSYVLTFYPVVTIERDYPDFQPPAIKERIIEIPQPVVPVVAKPEIAVKPPKSPQYRLYIVQEGDSLWKISRRFGVDMEAIKEQNRIGSSDLKPGTVLKIPLAK